ncbi:hypothetical protein KXW08_008448, partial [Aspergillus fumigatus]
LGWTDGSRATIRRSPVVWLIMCGAILSAAIVAGTVAMIEQSRDRALANGQRELENTILLLTRHFDQQFEDSNAIARSVIAHTGIAKMTSPDEFRQKMSGAEAHERLKSVVAALSFAGVVHVFDINGRTIGASADGPLPEID